MMKNFETKLQRLEEIVETLDQGDTPLDTLIKLYKEGITLIKELQQMLETAELEVKNIQDLPTPSESLPDTESPAGPSSPSDDRATAT